MSDVIPLSRKSTVRSAFPAASSVRPEFGYPSQDRPSRPPPMEGSARTAPRHPSTNLLKARVIENFKRLYPMPHVMVKARRIMNDPHADFSTLANVLRADPALAGRVLKVANSAYYRRRGSISSIQQAAALLGMRVVGQIVTLVSQSRMLGQALAGYGLSAGDLWQHSLAVATVSELLARQTGAGDSSEAFLGGLMHDAGKIILNPYLIERAGIGPAARRAAGLEALDMEQALLGFDHADIGSELCIKWQLPTPLANAIRFHHMPHLSSENIMAYVLHLADFMAHRSSSRPAEDDDASWDDMAAPLAFLGLTPAQASAMIESADERLETLEEDTF